MRQFAEPQFVTIRLGFQIPNFSYGTGVEQLFPTVIAQAREAESAGFDSIFVMDHINMPFYAPGVIAAVGEALRPLVGV